MRVALVYPPSCDPTGPYLSVPMLSAVLRARGIEVLAVDANLEGYRHLLRRSSLEAVRGRLERRLARLEARPRLDHRSQLAYLALSEAREEAARVPGRIEDALGELRDERAFFDPERYRAAVRTVEAAQGAIAAAYTPLTLSFTAYRTPFALLSPEEIERESRPERNPFHGYFRELSGRLAGEGLGAVGVSLVFPGQLQPGFALGLALKARLGEGVHLVVGGPALTQLLAPHRNDPERLARLLGPFDSAVLFEGETALPRLLEGLDGAGARRPLPAIPGVVLKGRAAEPPAAPEDLGRLPAPDFRGLPLDRYLAPRLVLPYDPTRGCYWGACAFCHYGLAEKGTAPYRERATGTVIEHLEELRLRHGTPYFYFSQDSVAPKTLVRLADGLAARGLDLRWATDLKPERYLDAQRARRLRAGGAVACALGVESAAPRVLGLIDKGAPVEVVRGVARDLAAAGIAVEAMCFTGFPTESCAEALLTVELLEQERDAVALFLIGEFDLTPGSLVATRPERYGVKEVWRVKGDELGLGLFYAEERPAKSAAELARLDGAIARLARGWLLSRYPWAGSLSTCHTILWYDRFGPGVFRRPGPPRPAAPPEEARPARSRYDLGRLARRAPEAEAAIWRHLIHERREVSRALYEELARGVGELLPAPARPRAGRVPRARVCVRRLRCLQ